MNREKGKRELDPPICDTKREGRAGLRELESSMGFFASVFLSTGQHQSVVLWRAHSTH
jgi:hypothetical protein